MLNSLAKLLEKLKVSFNVTPSTLILIITLISSTTYFYINNQNLKKQIPLLVSENKTLRHQVENLNGRIGTYDKIMETFIENPPALLQNQINRLDDLILSHHANTNSSTAPDSIMQIPKSLPNVVENN